MSMKLIKLAITAHKTCPHFCYKLSSKGFIISHTTNGMTTIPTVEKTELAKCSACDRDCVQLCIQCGNNFCKKHLLIHSEKCSGYKAVVHSILRDDLVETVKHVIEVMLRSI
jgi:hypothetical protein